MSDIKRKKGESFEGFMRRVKQQWQRSGKLLEVRKGQYFDPKQSKNRRRTSAVSRVRMKSKIAYLKKTGKLSEKDDKFAPKKKR